MKLKDYNSPICNTALTNTSMFFCYIPVEKNVITPIWQQHSPQVKPYIRHSLQEEIDLIWIRTSLVRNLIKRKLNV